MSETIVITTDDLEPAVRLRGGFEAGIEPLDERGLPHSGLHIEEVHDADHGFLPRTSWTSLAIGS